MILEAKNITFSYNKSKLLTDVSIKLCSDKIIGLIGDSGSGKSTLCKIISGYIKKYHGDVHLNKEEIVNDGYNPIQLIFQHPEKTMNPKWKMNQVLTESWNPPQKLKNQFGIKEDWMNRWSNELSGGELQRFSILRALNPKTKFIIADEITTMLDTVTQVQIWEALIDYTQENNVGVLAVSHDEGTVQNLTDNFFLKWCFCVNFWLFQQNIV